MTPTNVELYEALKPSIGEDAARMIAEVVPPTRDLATKADVDALDAATREDFTKVRGEVREEFARVYEEFAKVRGEMHEGFAKVYEEFAKVRGEMREGFALVRSDSHAERVSLLKWMIVMFVPLWLGSLGTVVAVLVKA